MKEALLTIIAISAVLGFANAPGSLVAQESTQTPPQWAVYTGLFEHVAFFESFADSLKAKGKDDKVTRSSIRRDIGLTEAEEALLKTVALSTLKRQQAARDERTRLKKKYPIQAWQARTVPSEDAKKIKQLYLDEMAAPDEAVAYLREKLGADRFAILDRYARARHGKYSAK